MLKPEKQAELALGDRLIWRADGTVYTIIEVRLTPRGGLFAYRVVDVNYWCVLVYPESLRRYEIIRTQPEPVSRSTPACEQLMLDL